MQENLKNESVIKNVKNIGIEVFYSQISHTIAPFLLEKKFLNYLNGILDFADSISIELNHPREILSLKNKNPEKLRYQLDILKKILLRNFAISACFEHEFIYGMRFAVSSVSNKIRPKSQILNRKKPNILVRLHDDMSEDYLFEALKVISESGIVNGILLDAMQDRKLSENLGKDNIKNSIPKAALPNSPSNKMIKKIRNLIGEKIMIISCSDVTTGEGVFYRLKSGADFVLVKEAFLKRGPYCLEKLVKELDDVMVLKNIKNVDEIKQRGKMIKKIEDDYVKYIYNNKSADGNDFLFNNLN